MRSNRARNRTRGRPTKRLVYDSGRREVKGKDGCNLADVAANGRKSRRRPSGLGAGKAPQDLTDWTEPRLRLVNQGVYGVPQTPSLRGVVDVIPPRSNYGGPTPSPLWSTRSPQ